MIWLGRKVGLGICLLLVIAPILVFSLAVPAAPASSQSAATANPLPGWFYLAAPLGLMLLGYFILRGWRRKPKERNPAANQPLSPTESSAASPEFQEVLQQEKERLTSEGFYQSVETLVPEPETNEPLIMAAEPVPESLDQPVEALTPDLEAATEVPAVAGLGSARREEKASAEEIHPEFSAENGVLNWPVHLLDGGRKGRILLVDDEAEVTAPLVEYLETEGYDVQGLSDSRQATTKYREWHPDVLLLEVAMPGISGVDLVKEICLEEAPRKIIFWSGRAERDSVLAAFETELHMGRYEFLKKPISLEQIGGRIKDYFSSAREVLHLNLLDPGGFAAALEPLSPHQLLALHRFVWDKVFETSVALLGRRIESVYITDRMEPADHYMRRMGCQERRDYCIASVCIVSNPMCAANRLRAELEIMRQILQEFREEYVSRVNRGIGAEDLAPATRRKKREGRKTTAAVETVDGSIPPPPRRMLRRIVTNRKR